MKKNSGVLQVVFFFNFTLRRNHNFSGTFKDRDDSDNN